MRRDLVARLRDLAWALGVWHRPTRGPGYALRLGRSHQKSLRNRYFRAVTVTPPKLLRALIPR